MRRQMLTSLAVALCLVIASSASASEINLVANGGFELGFANWSPPFDSTIDSFAHSGNFSAVVTSTISNAAPLSQFIQTEAGIQYELSFYLNNFTNSVPDPDNFFEVYFDGVLLYREEDRGDDDINWERFSFTVIGNGGSQELSLVFGNEDGWFYVDDVSVCVPVPAGFIMAGMGALGLAGMHLRRRALARKAQLA